MSNVHRSARQGVGVSWLVLAVVPALSIAALLALTPPLSVGRLGDGSLEEVLLTTGRWLGLALATWLLVSQLLYTAAVATRTNWMVDVLRPLTLPVVRRIAAGATAMSISLSGPVALAQIGPPPTIVYIDERPDVALRRHATPTPDLQPLPGTTAAAEVTASYSAPLTWQVRPGDHLWSIAAEHLTIVLDRPPTADEHCSYWVEVVDAARPIIRSGDPDLIHPGEQIPLPALLDAGITP